MLAKVSTHWPGTWSGKGTEYARRIRQGVVGRRRISERVELISPQTKATSRWPLKRLVPIPSHSVNRLKRDKETGLGYQSVSVQLRDGRHFDQAIASEGCIIAVRGYDDVPFTHDEVEYVAVNHKHWNFREYSDAHR